MSQDNDETPSDLSVLIDGSQPATATDVIAKLTSLGIENTTIEHAAMRTVEQSRQYRNRAKGGYPKNFFLRNKKGRMWVVTLHEERVVDLRDLARRIGANRVSFCSEERLMNYLGVIPGAVTPLAVINDRTRVVTAVLDAHLLSMDPLHFHPCDNTRTTTVSRQGLLDFMRACGHEPQIVDFDLPD